MKSCHEIATDKKDLEQFLQGAKSKHKVINFKLRTLRLSMHQAIWARPKMLYAIWLEQRNHYAM